MDTPQSASSTRLMNKEQPPTVAPPRGSVRTGGRSERIRQQVAEAVLSLMRAGNFHFDIKDIVELTGVHKTTIYRRWPTRQALINEAFREHNSRIQVADTGHWHSDLFCLGLVLRNFFNDPTEVALNGALAIATDADLPRSARESWLPIQEQMKQVMTRAKSRGEIPGTLDDDMVMRLLSAPLLTAIMFEKRYPSDQEVMQLTEFLVHACAVETHPTQRLSMVKP